MESTASSPLPKYRIELPNKPGSNAEVGQWLTRAAHKAVLYNAADQIGEGTYGTVFKGLDRATNDQVALKKIRMDTEQEGFPLTAVREIKILSSMQHENVVNLREMVSSDPGRDNNGKPCVSMVFDYAEHDLTGLMHSNNYRFTEAQIKCIMKQVLKGLAHVHGQGVLHRDIKASNILINKHGIVKLADFGLARTYDASDSRFTNKVITLWYRPPELLLGARKYGPGVDMWSMGCILAELLVGKPIFPGEDEPQQLDHIFSITGAPTEAIMPGVTSLPHWPMVRVEKYAEAKGLRAWLAEAAAQSRHRGNALNPAAIELLEKMLALDPKRRISALEAFQDPWFRVEAPSPCDPRDLPVGGSSHEYTMRKRHAEEKKQAVHAHPHSLARGGGGPQGGAAFAPGAHRGGHMLAPGAGGHHPASPSKRPRHNLPAHGSHGRPPGSMGMGGRGGAGGYAGPGRPPGSHPQVSGYGGGSQQGPGGPGVGRSQGPPHGHAQHPPHMQGPPHSMRPPGMPGPMNAPAGRPAAHSQQGHGRGPGLSMQGPAGPPRGGQGPPGGGPPRGLGNPGHPGSAGAPHGAPYAGRPASQHAPPPAYGRPPHGAQTGGQDSQTRHGR